MAESIKGSSSSLYIKDEVPSVTNSADTMNHLSVQNLWGARGAADTLVHGVHRNTTLPVLIEAGSVKRKIKITGHGAIAGDFLKMNNGSADGEEVSILKVIDADNFIISKEINASIGDEAFILKPVTQRLAKDGGLQISQGPVQYNDNQVGTPVEATIDLADATNNKALPSLMMIKKDDGKSYPVQLDTTNPYNHTPVPVTITDVTGTSNVNVNLTGSTLNVSIKHDSVDPSSVQIGDGTAGVTAQIENDGTNKNLRVHDKKVKDAIGTMDGHLTDKTQKTQITDGANEAQVFNDGTKKHLRVFDELMRADLSNGDQVTQIVDSGNIPVSALDANVNLTDTDHGLVTHSLISGPSADTAGIYPKMKIRDSGRATVESMGSTVGQSAVLLTDNMNLIGARDENGDAQILKVDSSTKELLVKATGIVSVSSSALPTGAATSGNQDTGNSSLANIEAGVGLKADAAASSDIGSFSIIQFIKRGMQNWTTLLNRIPAIGAQAVGSSISIVQATSHTFAVKEAQPTPTYQQSLVIANTGITVLTGPTTARGCKVMAGYGNSADLKFTVDGSTNPAANIGFELQPGRSEDFEGALEVRVIAKTAATNQEIYVHWRA